MPLLQIIEETEDLRQELAQLQVTAIYHPARVNQDQLDDLESLLQAKLDLIDSELSLHN